MTFRRYKPVAASSAEFENVKKDVSGSMMQQKYEPWKISPRTTALGNLARVWEGVLLTFRA
jgi:hypothetical protein